MANAVLEKFSAPAALTITLGGLANGNARQSTVVDNTTTRYRQLIVFVKVKNGTSPTASTTVGVYLIRDDGGASPLRTDNAGASDAAITLQNAAQIGSLVNASSPATGDVLTGEFVVPDPGPKFAVAVKNGTGVALDATNGNHVVEFVGVYPEIQ